MRGQILRRLLASMLMFAVVVQLTTHAATAQDALDDTTRYYAIYTSAIQTGDYEWALENLRWILENAPASYGGGRKGDRNFERAIVLYDTLAAQAGDRETERAYLDTALALHDQAVAILPAEGVVVDEHAWSLAKGGFIQRNLDVLDDNKDEMIQLYERAYELEPEQTDTYYLTVLIGAYVEQNPERAIEFMEEVESQRPDDDELTEYVSRVRNALFQTPEDRLGYLENQLERRPDDIDLVAELFDVYRELGMRDQMFEIGDRLMELEPTPRTYRILAQLHLEEDEPQQALELYERAVQMAGETTVQDHYNMGIAQQQVGRLVEARRHFRSALELDPEYGSALIGIGDLYAAAVSNCGSYDRTDQAVYWLAVDYYERARAVDASAANAAAQRIRTYRNAFPDAEALFYQQWEVGQPYRVNYGCYSWINEMTTVKSPG